MVRNYGRWLLPVLVHVQHHFDGPDESFANLNVLCAALLQLSHEGGHVMEAKLLSFLKMMLLLVLLKVVLEPAEERAYLHMLKLNPTIFVLTGILGRPTPASLNLRSHLQCLLGLASTCLLFLFAPLDHLPLLLNAFADFFGSRGYAQPVREGLVTRSSVEVRGIRLKT